MGTSPGKEYTRNQVLTCLAKAHALISDAVYDADDLMDQVLNLAGFGDGKPDAVYSREAVISRLNHAADSVLDGPRFDTETGATVAQRSLIDLLVNTAGAVLDNPDVNLNEAIRLGWADLDTSWECDGQPYIHTDGINVTECGEPFPHPAHTYRRDTTDVVLGWLDDLP